MKYPLMTLMAVTFITCFLTVPSTAKMRAKHVESPDNQYLLELGKEDVNISLLSRVWNLNGSSFSPSTITTIYLTSKVRSITLPDGFLVKNKNLIDALEMGVAEQKNKLAFLEGFPIIPLQEAIAKFILALELKDEETLKKYSLASLLSDGSQVHNYSIVKDKAVLNHILNVYRNLNAENYTKRSGFLVTSCQEAVIEEWGFIPGLDGEVPVEITIVNVKGHWFIGSPMQ